MTHNDWSRWQLQLALQQGHGRVLQGDEDFSETSGD
jgi:hypothetical protein